MIPALMPGAAAAGAMAARAVRARVALGGAALAGVTRPDDMSAAAPPSTDPRVLLTAGLALGLVFAGFLGWRRLARTMRPLAAGATTSDGWMVALLGFVTTNLAGAFVIAALGYRRGEDIPLEVLMASRAAVSILVVGLLLAWIRQRHGSLRSLGLDLRVGPSLPTACLAAVCAWLAFFPLIYGTSVVNAWMLERLEVPGGLQDYLRRFLEEPQARHSLPGWLSMVVVLPICEEILFRGGLFGALRTVVPPFLAILLSGLAFGLLHDGPAALPVATLGCVLAWLYQRSGSLAVPIAFHVLQNGLTLAMLTSFPQLAGSPSPG